MKNANISVMMLKALDSLRETGSISRTAEQLHVTQAAVSHAVKAIETGLLGNLEWIETRPLSDGAEAFDDLDKGRSAAAKVVLIPN